jgi:hypothetical protein
MSHSATLADSLAACWCGLGASRASRRWRSSAGPEPRLDRRVDRRGRGSLRGALVMSEDWDSGEVNQAIASDFGLVP